MTKLLQGGRKVRRKAHNLEIGGSSPLPARKEGIKGIYYPTTYGRDVRQTAFFLRQVFFEFPTFFEMEGSQAP